jgi:hypothetical protein
MAMVVNIINITDAPESKKTPTRLAIYTTHLDPGEELKLPAAMVDARIKKLAEQGYIAIGQLPSWYAASKARKLGQGRRLTQAELEERLVTKVAETPAPEPEKMDAPTPKAKRISLSELSGEDKKPADKK